MMSVAADRTDFARMLAEIGMTVETMKRLESLPHQMIDFPGQTKACAQSSAIDKTGLFATQPIRAGELIGAARVGDQLTPAGRYINHSGSPNAEFTLTRGDVEVIALRDIETGEEITNDYRRNAVVMYASVHRCAISDVTQPMVREAMRLALQRIN